MARTANKIMSGTWGKVLLEGDDLYEVSAFMAKVTYNKEDVQMAGDMMIDTKVISCKGTGTLTLKKMNSRMAKLLGQKILNGIDQRFSLIGALDDPDASGKERISISNISFDELTLMDWAVGEIKDVEVPFTFTKYKTIDLVA